MELQNAYECRQQLMNVVCRLKERCGGTVIDSAEYPGYSKPTTPFRPYSDYCGINLAQNPYEDDENPEEAEDYAISKFINNMLANQALSLARNKDYHEEFDGQSAYAQEKIPDSYKVRPNEDQSYTCNDRLPRKKIRHGSGRQGRAGRKGAKGCGFFEDDMLSDLPVGSEVTMKEGQLMINMPVDVLKQYMYSEIESRVWTVNEHYRRQWATINMERMTTLAELVKVKENSVKLQAEVTEMKNTLNKYKEMCDNLGTKVESSKEAKRRRRQAKKQRKTENPSTAPAPGYQTETGSGDGLNAARKLDNDPHTDLDLAAERSTLSTQSDGEDVD